MTKFRGLTIEHSLYFLAFILAFGVRFLHLGAAPLSDAEAHWALQALNVARGSLVGGGIAIGPQPAYVFLTAGLFEIFGSTNFLARFWPALAGSLLVALPYLIIAGKENEFANQPALARRAALIMAFGLALDPGLASVSRQAGGPMMAASFLLLAFGWWYSRKPILAGIFSGLALLSGPAVLMGILGLGLTWGVNRLLGISPSWLPFSERLTLTDQDDPPTAKPWRLVLISAAATILLAGTFVFAIPEGLAAWFDTLPTYLQGWITFSGITPLRLLATIIVYQPLAFVFGLIAAVKLVLSWRTPQDAPAWLAVWSFIMLILIILYPSHQVADLVWVLVPLWALAAMEFSRYAQPVEANLIALSQGALIFILLALFWLTLAGVARAVPGTIDMGARIGILLGIIALGALTSVLVSLGWSRDVGQSGLVWGVSAGVGVYLVAALWGAAQLRPNQPQELWYPSPGSGQAALMMETLSDLSRWHTGFQNQIEVISEVNAPSMRWLLRNFPKAQFLSEPAAGELPPVIISSQTQETPALTTSYRGQDFLWWTYPDWTSPLPPQTISWLVFREAPIKNEHVILWARGDLFPGGASEPQKNSSGME